MLTITARKDGINNKTAILFRESASNAYLLNEDSHKLFLSGTANAVPVVVYTRSTDGYALDVNVFGDCTKEIPLGIRTSRTGLIDLEFGGIENFLPGYEVFLLDLAGGKKINLKETPNYSFEKTDTENFMDGRLYLTFNKVISGLSASQSTASVFVKGTVLQVISNNTPVKTVQIVDMQGHLLHDEANIESFVYTHDLERGQMYIVKVLTKDGLLVKKITTGN